MILLISLGLDPSLITKVSLHTFPPPDPPFSPPQTFAKLIAMKKGKIFREDTCFFILNVFPPIPPPSQGPVSFALTTSTKTFILSNMHLFFNFPF